MSDDLLTRLRTGNPWDEPSKTANTMDEAADTIESLTRELDEARAWRIEAQDTIVLLTRQLEERANTIAKLMTAFISIELSADDLERRCANLGYDNLADAANDIVVTARKALEGKGP